MWLMLMLMPLLADTADGLCVCVHIRWTTTDDYREKEKGVEENAQTCCHHHHHHVRVIIFFAPAIQLAIEKLSGYRQRVSDTHHQLYCFCAKTKEARRHFMQLVLSPVSQPASVSVVCLFI
uniref:Secreted protein n=1 Tax=Syphacia muris TaxID=451379 RepID=A0A0N5AL22_9BILA